MSTPLPSPVQSAVWIDLNLIDLPANARYHSDDEIDNMSKSLANKQLMPIIVCREGDRYEVVAGACRVLGARKDAWQQIKADVYEGLTPFQKLMITFTENEDRKNASPL
jgi:ParB-like chromosome segregation protein Spo0J